MGRFGEIRFNFLRAMEIFQDLNHEDMDVCAPPSNRECTKEFELAIKLNEYLSQLIDNGFFDDCELRATESSVEDEVEDDSDDDEEYSDEGPIGTGTSLQTYTPESSGFGAPTSQSSVDSANNGQTSSRESLGHRFRRYVRRILPGGGGGSSSVTSPPDSSGASQNSRNSSSRRRFLGMHEENQISQTSEDDEGSNGDLLSDSNFNHQQHQRANSTGSERSGSEPYNPSIVYEHRHRHKHNHPGPHHHHEHSPDHQHTYHVHAGSRSSSARLRRSRRDEDGISSSSSSSPDDRLLPQSRANSTRSRGSSQRSSKTNRSNRSQRSGSRRSSRGS